MNKDKAKGKGALIFLVLSVLFAALAGFAFMRYTSSFNESVTVPVAAKDIGPYTKITADMVKMAEIPRITLPKDALSKLDDILDKYTKESVLSGEPIRDARLAHASGKDSVLTARLSALGKPDVRAFALPCDPDTAVGGEVATGDRVDLIASVRMEAQNSTVGFGKIVGRNVLVLDVAKPSQGKTSLILALTPQEIEDIAFALTSGTIRVALNPYETDEQAANTVGVTGQDWLLRHGFGAVQGGE